MKVYENANYTVIFSSCKNVPLDSDYYKMQAILNDRVQNIEGYVARENVIDASGNSITISYWEHLDALRNWFLDEKHQVVQELGKSKWYSSFKTIVCKIERQKVWNFK